MAQCEERRTMHNGVSEAAVSGLDVIDTDTALDYCRDRIRHFKRKADHNKREALRLFMALIACTLGAPLLITLGSGLLWGKVAPSLLSTVATGCAVWLQQRKPQQLWTLYRTMQRRLEFEEVSHRFQMNDYEGSDDPDKTLAAKTAAIDRKSTRLNSSH